MSPGFRPKRLPAESIEAPLDPRWKVMGPEEARRLHQKALAEHRKFARFGGRWRRRMGRYVLGTAVGFAAMGWLFVGGNLRTAAVFAGAGVVLGALMAMWRPLDFTAGALYALFAMGATLLCGAHNLLTLLIVLLVGMVFGCVGIAMGRVEEQKRLDLED